MYVIRVNKQKKYLSIDETTGKPSITTNLVICQHFDTATAANNYIKNCIPKAARKRYESVPYEDEVSPWMELPPTLPSTDTSDEEDNKFIEIIEAAEEEEAAINQTKDIDLDYEVDWEHEIKTFVAIIERVKLYNKVCKKKLNEVNHLKLTDMHHFIEFNDLNGVDGFKAYKKLQDQLKLRRKLKDTVLITEEIINTLFETHDPESSLELLKNLDSRHYRPRIYPELFEEGASALTKIE